MMNNPPNHKVTINTNTPVSIGVVTSIFGLLIWIIAGQSGNARAMSEMKNEMAMQAMSTKNELLNKIDKLEVRMNNYEVAKNSWTSTAMFKWAVHLQQANPQIKVPEPEVETK